MKRYVMLCFLLFTFFLWLPLAYCASDIINTKHNLSASGPGTIKASIEDKICIFCHTPHNATPLTPLWNRQISEGTTYIPYDSTTIHVSLSKPVGPSRLCLSCHDGTIGLGAVLSVPGGIQMTAELTGRPSLIGTDLSNDHPVSFSYGAAQAQNNELRPQVPSELYLYNGDTIHCSTCHDPHDDSFGMFLMVDNKNSQLCIKCHVLYGWETSSHATSTKTWIDTGTNVNPWPLNERIAPQHVRTTVAENGCENCHTPHNAAGPQRLQHYLAEEDNCLLACHNGNVTDASKDIASQFMKFSRHRVENTTIGDTSGNFHDPAEDVTYLTGHVECADCHNPHTANNAVASAPNVSGPLQNVSGLDENGALQSPALYEYQICYKCHAASNSDTPHINRYVVQTDVAKRFNSVNPSYHPVTAAGVNSNVPSLPVYHPGTISLDPTLSESSMIYCSDCHSSNGTVKVGGAGPNGPHGSDYDGLLREEYALTGGQAETYARFALCYRCHDRANILSDVSFQKNSAGNGGHSGHLASGGGTTCSTCHDPHGVENVALTGDHQHLINFDSAVVSPVSGQTYPLFSNGLSDFSGSCTLVCHGVIHDGNATYTYP